MRSGLGATRPPLRVLLVEDDPQSRRFAARVLEAAGAHIELASNGEAAIAAAAHQPYDLILMDLHMPGIDGADAALAIRAAERDAGRAAAPIVALTGHVDRALRDRCRSAGVTDFIVKPLAPDALVGAIERWGGNGAAPDGQQVAGSNAPSGAATTPDAGITGTRDSAPISLNPDPLVADLVPGYLRDRRRQLAESRDLIGRREFGAIERMAHDFKGTGSAYGIPDVTRLARDLEIACRRNDVAKVVGVIDELDDVLARAQQEVGERRDRP
jgi:CheY-like chemotaxis protein